MRLLGAARRRQGHRIGSPAQAVQALESGSFIIRAEEFYFMDGKPMKSSPDTYISMNNGWGVAHYSPDLFPEIDLMYLEDTNDHAKISKGITRKNGDTEFTMEIGSSPYKRSQKIVITLYGNTNKCFVTANLGHAAKFSGLVYPSLD